MLNYIHLTNFGCHRDLRVDFAPGINAIKAGVEKGKSTAIRAVAYALFGTRALPDSLDDTVTWGEPVASLRVELAFNLNGVDYLLTRSKSSAELTYGQESVTGQTETAKFVADLLGADAALAANLIIAGQGEIRGALAAGSKGAVALIEKLAGFELLDELIDLLQSQLVTGNTAGHKQALEQARELLESTPEVGEIDREALQARVDRAEADEAKLKGEVSTLAQQVKSAEQARDREMASGQRRRELSIKIEDRTKALASMDAERPAAPEWTELDNGALAAELRNLDELEASVNNSKLVAAMREANDAIAQRFGDIEDASNTRAEGSREQVRKELDAAMRRVTALRDKATKLSYQAQIERTKIQTDSCTLCGKDLSEFPEVAERNAKHEQAALADESEAAKLDAECVDLVAHVTALKGALAAGDQLASNVAGFVKLDETFTPGRLVWEGPGVVAGAANLLPAAKGRVEALQRRKQEVDYTWRALTEHTRRYEKASAELEALKAELANMQETGDLDALRGEVTRLGFLRDAAHERYAEAVRSAAATRTEVSEMLTNHDMRAAARAQALKQAAAAETALKELEFNNALLKAVREARPIVANKLWSLVLGAVSEYFTAMRGTPSEVSRDADGFKVDGHPVSTLSGSTKDVLGLAIRVALTRTFLPNISLLMLDEPNAAMDDERTSNVLGFLGGAGFDQTVVVSHDELTVDVADHIVTLE